MSLPERICLCGFMGAGKTAVGKKLAQKLNYTFIDLDGRIAEQAGKSIAEIFQVEGEQHFRKLEEEAGLAALNESGVVIALGGGALTNPGLRAAVREHSYQVYLQASPEMLYRRTRRVRNRPVIAGANSYDEFLTVHDERMQDRRAGYEQSHLTVVTDDLSVNRIADWICGALKGSSSHA